MTRRARLALALRYLWATRPLLCLGYPLAVGLGAACWWLGVPPPPTWVAQSAVLLLAEVGHRLTVPRRAHDELVALARTLPPP